MHSAMVRKIFQIMIWRIDIPAKEKLRKGFQSRPQSSRSFWVESLLFWFRIPQTQSRSRHFLGALRRSSLVDTQSYCRWQTRRSSGRKNTSLRKVVGECIKRLKTFGTSFWKYILNQKFDLGLFVFFYVLSVIYLRNDWDFEFALKNTVIRLELATQSITSLGVKLTFLLTKL